MPLNVVMFINVLQLLNLDFFAAEFTVFFSTPCRLERKKTTKLQSPNFHLSKTRLVIYNLPRSMHEKELKKLCIDAVKSRVTKQTPMIRQVSLSFFKDAIIVLWTYIQEKITQPKCVAPPLT